MWNKLTGQNITKPRRYPAIYRFSKTVADELQERTDVAHREFLAKAAAAPPVATSKSKKPQKTKNTRLPLWTKERDSMWDALPVEEQKNWQKISDDVFAEEEKDYAKSLNSPVSKDPEDIQKCV